MTRLVAGDEKYMNPPDEHEMEGRWFSVLFPLALTAVILLVYGPVMSGKFIWDDYFYIVHNRTLQSGDGLRQIWFVPGATPQYYPLVFTSFWIEYRLWGWETFGYHLVNVLLHAANALLLWRLLRRWSVPGAWLAAAIFALHPVHVESVAMISERKNVLSGLFSLLTVLAYFRSCDFREGGEERRAWRWYALSLSLFLCALLSKTAVCTLPVIILLLLWWKRGSLSFRQAIWLAPFLVMSAAMGLLTVWVEQHYAGAEGAKFVFTVVERCLIAGRAFWFYAVNVLWPLQLGPLYPRWRIDTASGWQYLFPLAALAVGFFLWLWRRQIGTGALVAFGVFAVALLPSLGFISFYLMLYTFVADHLVYLPSAGLIAGAGALMAHWTRGRAAVFGAASVAILIGLSWISWQQTHTYWDLETFWRTAVAQNPTAAMTHSNLGTALSQKRKLTEATTEFRKALQLDPDYADAWNNLGYTLAQQGKLDESVACYAKAVKLDSKVAMAHNNLAMALWNQGKKQEAAAEFSEALRLDPELAEAHNNLGTLLLMQGKTREAMAHFQTALQSRPDLALAHNNLGLALASQGKLTEAISEYTAALRLDPELARAHNNRGVAFASQGKLREAAAEFTEALQISPDFADARKNLREARARLRGGH